MSRDRQYVLFPLGEKRFALPAACVTELARAADLQSFPHTSRLISGVLVRRGTIVPVLDIAQQLVGASAPPRRFYLIASRRFERETELTAIPVTGECEMANAEALPPRTGLPRYVTGLLSLNHEIVEIISLEKIAGEGAL